jgi:phosphoribosylformylglycinamidine synthase
MGLIHFYRIPAWSEAKEKELLLLCQQKISPEIIGLKTEYCFNIETTSAIIPEEMKTLKWLLSETFEPENLSDISFLSQNSKLKTQKYIFEVGHRRFTTAGQQTLFRFLSAGFIKSGASSAQDAIN